MAGSYVMGVIRQVTQYVGKKIETLKKFKETILDSLADT